VIDDALQANGLDHGLPAVAAALAAATQPDGSISITSAIKENILTKVRSREILTAVVVGQAGILAPPDVAADFKMILVCTTHIFDMHLGFTYKSGFVGFGEQACSAELARVH
jgi:hypothetical protein